MKEEIRKCNSKKCKKPYKSISEFNKDSSSKDGISPRCAECTRELQKKHYQKHKAKYREITRKKKKELKIWIDNIKKKLKCNKCGDKRFYVLDFHHKNTKDKNFTVSQCISLNLNKNRILEEIKKCDVLCSNCHREFHYFEKLK